MGCQVEGQDEEQLRFLLAHDRDPFSRWEAGQRLLRMLLTALYSTAADESKVRMLRTEGRRPGTFVYGGDANPW